jgi:thioredoxin reductase
VNDEFEAVIVGMGPAGMAAAVELCRLGAHIAVIDEGPGPGGQAYRQVSPDFAVSDPRFLGVKYKEGRRLIRELDSVRSQCTIYNDAYVWGAFDDRSLAVVRDNEIRLIGYQKLLLCEGAMERSLPFPGWTLPGIMTLGGLQKLVEHERMLPGRRFLLAGCSPLLFPVAGSIIEAGGEVAAMCDAVPSSRYLRLVPQFWKQKEIARETFSYLFPVLRQSIPVLRPSAVISASGRSRVEEVRVAKLDSSGRPITGLEKTFQVDILGVSHGFLPSGRLARLAGCDHVYDPVQRCWRPRTSDCMRSSLPDISIAGDCAGIGGRKSAEVEGRLAAIRVAGELGRISDREERLRTSDLGQERARLQQYARALHQVFSVPPGLLHVMDKNTVVCRCEQVTLGDVLAGIEKGYRNINEIKRTRTAMGMCQGRTCESIVAQIMLQQGLDMEEIGHLNLRPPLSPMPLALLEHYAKANDSQDRGGSHG